MKTNLDRIVPTLENWESYFLLAILIGASILFVYQYLRAYKSQPPVFKVLLGLCALLSPVALVWLALKFIEYYS